jgi:hypothetical protein
MADPNQDMKRNQDQKQQKRGVVGNDIPDESKERHTEIAVEAGRKGAEEQKKTQELPKR